MTATTKAPALQILNRATLAHAQAIVASRHYLGRPVDARCSVEGAAVHIGGGTVGYLLLGRPQATRCYPWYGSVEDVARGRARCTRWQVLNLARVWFSPAVQPGGGMHSPDVLPGFVDRRGVFRSTLASTAIGRLAARVRVDYLLQRPPCFLDEPYQLAWLLSYCDTRRHRGALYRAAGFELFRTNADGVQTWRLPLAPLTPDEDALVRAAAARSPRSIEYRNQRAQLSCFTGPRAPGGAVAV